MKKLFLPLLWMSAATALCSAEQDLHAGVYRQWGGGIYTFIITLLTNGNYLARWDADVGSNGTASGSWEVIGNEIHLTPRKEDGPMMRGYLRVLLIREKDGRKALLREEDVKNEKNPMFYFYLERAPNKSPEATPGQRSPEVPSPSSGAPHL